MHFLFFTWPTSFLKTLQCSIPTSFSRTGDQWLACKVCFRQWTLSLTRQTPQDAGTIANSHLPKGKLQATSRPAGTSNGVAAPIRIRSIAHGCFEAARSSSISFASALVRHGVSFHFVSNMR